MAGGGAARRDMSIYDSLLRVGEWADLQRIFEDFGCDGSRAIKLHEAQPDLHWPRARAWS